MPTLPMNGIDVYYESHGAGAALLLINGLGADFSLLAPLTGELARHRRVVVFDNRGAGRTGKPDQPYSVELMARDTVGLMDALGIARADLLGISMGGRIALELALTHPDRVRRLVLVSTSAAGRGKVHMSLPMRLLWLLHWLPGRHGRYPQPGYAHRRQRDAAVRYDATARLDRIHAPTLILHGRRDRSLPLSMAEQLHAGIAGSQLAVFRGGHMFAFLSQRPAFLARVEEFLTDRPVRGSGATPDDSDPVGT
ncbi:alpha/beta fold hydrolase [Micromonospora sp. MS34]|uniref:alpha/beta fold hydrolase n=1 Tax=Micromonospora sp. MS34 TaxID=3385971 RepID=UPI0039A2D571